MISKDFIKEIIEKELTDDDQFIAELKIDSQNRISVFVDSLSGFSIDDCVKISRAIEGNLDREVEDFELQVSTPGLELPFRVPQQYFKNIDREIEVKCKDGKKYQGVLTNITDDSFTITYTEMVKVEGKKKKQEVTQTPTFKMNEGETKVIVSFK